MRLSTCLMLIVALPIATLVSAGCSHSSKLSRGHRASKTDEDRKFEAGVDRPPTPRTLYSMTRILAAQQRDAECEAALARIIREYPDFVPAYCDLAQLQVKQRRLDDAIRTLDAARSVSGRDAVLLNDLGMCSMLKGEYKEALDLFTKAAAIAPDNARYRTNMAAALGMMGRYEEAFTLYRQAVPKEDAQHNLGVLRQAREKALQSAYADRLSSSN